MVEKILKIDTTLGMAERLDNSDPLLLTDVDASEGISVPFNYRVTMVRDPDLGRLEEPQNLIGTPARIGIRDYDPRSRDGYTYRLGVFVDFQEVGRTQHGFWAYKAQIIPAFMLLGREVRFRIFEGKDVVQVLDAVLGLMKERYPFPSLSYDLSRLKAESFPKMEYCVQFRETTFAFLSRLMARFGIWYMFHGDYPAPGQDWKAAANNDTMVLGRSTGSMAGKEIPEYTLIDDNPDLKDGRGQITNLSHQFEPGLNRIFVGNFNILKPTAPLTAVGSMLPGFDLMPGARGSAFIAEEFPAPIDEASDSASGSNGASAATADQAKDYARVAIEAEEAGTFRITAASKTSELWAGGLFSIGKDSTNSGEQGSTYLVTKLTFHAFENSYQTTTGQDIGDFFSSIWGSIKHVFGGSHGAVDATMVLAGNGLNNWLQNEAMNDLIRAWYPGSSQAKAVSQSGSPQFAPAFAGGVIASAGSVLPWLAGTIEGAVDKVIANNAGDYGNSFEAMRWYPKLQSNPLPAPKGSPPSAFGPHLAVVIGPAGLDAKGKPEVYADALGRVRVRFPWDPGPPVKPATYPISWVFPNHQDPWSSDQDTCWVRVSEGWAGAGYGSQFLPRIGEEVIVDFLDGDPERPIITGRVYNACNGPTNLPFPTPGTEGTPIRPADIANPTPSNGFLRSGIRTRATPYASGDKRFHLLRFDDTKGSEQLLLRSQGRFDVTAMCSRYETTLGNRHVKVTRAKDKNGNSIGGSSFTSIGGECDVHIGGARYEQVQKNYELTVKADTLLDLEGKLTAVVFDAASLAADSIVLQATTKITLKVGGSSIVIAPAAIYLNGPVLHHNAGDGGAGTASSATLQNVADAETADDGTENTNKPTDCSGPRGGGQGGGGQGGGARGTHTASPQDPLQVSSDPLDPTNIEIKTDGPWPTR